MKFKLNLKQRIKRPFFWMGVLLFLSVAFGILFRIFGLHWMYIGAIAPWGPLGLFIVVGIIFAFIINPIRGLIRIRKEKKSKKETEE